MWFSSCTVYFAWCLGIDRLLSLFRLVCTHLSLVGRASGVYDIYDHIYIWKFEKFGRENKNICPIFLCHVRAVLSGIE